MKITTTLLVLMLCLSLLSCEKVIDVKLNDAEKMYIIEGEINDTPGPYEVRVSRSANFNEPNGFIGESGAVVTLFDMTAKRNERLIETRPGIYVTSRIQGKRGHEYKLEVAAGGRLFSASSVMPNENVRLEKLYTQVSDFNDDDIYIVPVYTDPVGIGNYYRLRQYVNGKFIPGSVARSDEATDGNTMVRAMTYQIDEQNGRWRIKPGDRIRVEMQCVDKGVYDYFRTFENTTTANTSNPSNPLTNFSGGALGIFNACTVSFLEAVVESENY